MQRLLQRLWSAAPTMLLGIMSATLTTVLILQHQQLEQCACVWGVKLH